MMARGHAARVARRAARSRPMLWVLMLAFPFPYIATTAGWMTAELGRQPWLVYGLMRTVGRRQPHGARGHDAVHADRFLPGCTSCSACCSCSWSAARSLTGRAPLDGLMGAHDQRRCAVVELWFGIAAVMLAAYVVLDGFDLGAGALHLFVARTDRERRQVLAAIGPFWDGNEVWLLATGGVLFVAFPPVLASGLSGFYFAIFLVLWIADPARHRHRVPQPRRAPALAGRVGLRVLRRRARCCRCCSAPRSATWFAACRWTRTAGSRCRSSPTSRRSRRSASSTGTRCSSGVFALLALAGHGAHVPGVEDRRRGAGAQPPDRDAARTPRWRPLATGDGATGSSTRICVALPGGRWHGCRAARRRGLTSWPWASAQERECQAFLGSCAFLTGMLAATAACVFPVMLDPSTSPRPVADGIQLQRPAREPGNRIHVVDRGVSAGGSLLRHAVPAPPGQGGRCGGAGRVSATKGRRILATEHAENAERIQGAVPRVPLGSGRCSTGTRRTAHVARRSQCSPRLRRRNSPCAPWLLRLTNDRERLPETRAESSTMRPSPRTWTIRTSASVGRSSRRWLSGCLVGHGGASAG